MHFKGTYTALITPFYRDESVDFDALEQLVERQIEVGVEGIVPVGTTGESPTLRPDEHLKVIERVVRVSAGRCKVIAGTGANSTAEAVELTLAAKAFGVDGTLQVTPYYNKPNDKGLICHFSAVADLGVPVVLYNVPGRTSREIPISVVAELAQHPHVVSVKEAAGSVERVSEILNVCSLEVLSGDDVLAVPMIEAGACGVISVASNVIPRQLSEMIRTALAGKMDEARVIHQQWAPLFDDLFIDTNPIPVKAAAAMLGMADEVYRLPLCPMQSALRDQLQQTMIKLGMLG
ncbi:MAG: 4-hydroxy-tetrahydrodipicolinate synthase [Kiritimatiellaceae bacterium]|jgi:4-hydroxy-tetrahydrodipicolinate synthase|nr:4-hydroxy-tetrahydrodipicolinate synthase [Kiritimatiellaceae bacterium]|tara:strand:- start:172 stop:1044 length:873 start_codon:yes stop_codon:yes gene_type:complete